MKLATGGKFCVRAIVVRPNDKTIVRQLKEYLFWDFLTNLLNLQTTKNCLDQAS